MCGRFTLRTSPATVATLFQVDPLPLQPRYNIAPTQSVPAVRERASGGREMVMMHWGLIPSWADDRKIGNRMINARAETVSNKPAFRSAFRRRRCLVVADGFYEWKKTGGGKQPFYIRMKDDAPFAFAGLWEKWGHDPAIESCTIITTAANALMEDIHDRMPVILPVDQYHTWLTSTEQRAAQLTRLLQPYPSDLMEAYPIRTIVNNPRNESAECIVPES